MTSTTVNIPQKAFFRPDEVAQIFSVSVRTVRRWREEGKFEGQTLSVKCVRYPRHEIVKFINTRSFTDT